METCTECNKTKLKADFSGRHKQCRICMREDAKKHYYKYKIIYRKYQQSPKGQLARRKCHLKREYGITLDEHCLMYILQNGKCAICKELVAYDKMDTDHNHKTDKVRGLLCHQCNVGLGAFKENLKSLRNAIRYLKL